MEGLRSEPMKRVQLFVQTDTARAAVDQLARVGVLEFIDLNADKSALQRRFVNELKRCDEMERKIRYFADQVTRMKIEVPFDAQKLEDEDSLRIDEMEAHFEDLEKELKEMAKGQEQLDRNYNELVEMHYVLAKDSAFFSESQASVGVRPEDSADIESPASAAPLMPGRYGGSQAKAASLGFITGVILTEKMALFERVVFRALRGNMFMKHAAVEEPLSDPVSGEDVLKTAFIVFFSGETSRRKVKKICETFHANVYPCPESAVEREALILQLETKMSDMRRVLDGTIAHRREVLGRVALQVEAWSRRVKKEKALYHALNMFNYDITHKALMAEAWVPERDIGRANEALRIAAELSHAVAPSPMEVIETRDTPPTCFRSAGYMKPFQDMTESYGVPRYQEVNPAVVSAMTFPFLFAVMYGDVVHGIIMTLAALVMILREKQLEKAKLGEVVQMAFGGRYLILVMGLFSIYTGLLYNEWLSRPMNLFGTAWYYPHGSDTAVKIPGYTYAFGVDPVWKDTVGELAYYNSLKMKMSIVFGVSHMFIGLICKLLNAIHFKQWRDIYCEWIPEVIFLMSLFGYLVIVIFIKWYTDFVATRTVAPSLITLLINMFLSPGTVENELFAGQGKLQVALVLLMVICVPWMLLVKPLLERREHNRRRAQYSQLEEVEHEAPAGHGHGHGQEGFQFGEVMVHQVIHTIEYALGTISNTASYLRLWALSLAHSELANVFWQKVLIGRIGQGSNLFVALQIFIGMAAFFGATMGVLMVMESLSAFLHALRLHWVEFQNKFYAGDGKKFKPYSYRAFLNPNED